MFMHFWTGLWCPVLAGFAGYLLTHNVNGVTAGLMAYCVLAVFSWAARLYDRADFWASKMAMLRAEESALHLALAGEPGADASSPRRGLPDAAGVA